MCIVHEIVKLLQWRLGATLIVGNEIYIPGVNLWTMFYCVEAANWISSVLMFIVNVCYRLNAPILCNMLSR